VVPSTRRARRGGRALSALLGALVAVATAAALWAWRSSRAAPQATRDGTHAPASVPAATALGAPVGPMDAEPIAPALVASSEHVPASSAAPGAGSAAVPRAGKGGKPAAGPRPAASPRDLLNDRE
jgi:hypothetical protein